MRENAEWVTIDLRNRDEKRTENKVKRGFFQSWANRVELLEANTEANDTKKKKSVSVSE